GGGGGGFDRRDGVAVDRDHLRSRQGSFGTDHVGAGNGAGCLVHHGTVLGGIRSALAGSNEWSKISPGVGVRGSSNEVAMLEIADFSLLSLTSPRPISRVSWVSISSL